MIGGLVVQVVPIYGFRRQWSGQRSYVPNAVM